MDIRFVSSLSPDDECGLAGHLLNTASALLDRLPIAYSLRIVTSGGRQFDRVHYPETTSEDSGPDAVESTRAVDGVTGTPGMAAGTRVFVER